MATGRRIVATKLVKKPNPLLVWSQDDENKLRALLQRKETALEKHRGKLYALVCEMPLESSDDDQITQHLIETADDFIKALRPFSSLP